MRQTAVPELKLKQTRLIFGRVGDVTCRVSILRRAEQSPGAHGGCIEAPGYPERAHRVARSQEELWSVRAEPPLPAPCMQDIVNHFCPAQPLNAAWMAPSGFEKHLDVQHILQHHEASNPIAGGDALCRMLPTKRSVGSIN